MDVKRPNVYLTRTAHANEDRGGDANEDGDEEGTE